MGPRHNGNPFVSCEKDNPRGVNETPSWVESTQVRQWAMKKKKIFPNGLHIFKDFPIGQNHHQTYQQVLFPQ